MEKRITLGVLLFGFFTLAILLYLPRNKSYNVIPKKEHDKIVKILQEEKEIDNDIMIRLKCKISGYEKL